MSRINNVFAMLCSQNNVAFNNVKAAAQAFDKAIDFGFDNDQSFNVALLACKSLTLEEVKWQRDCYGCLEIDLQTILDRATSHPLMIAMGMCSDMQEELDSRINIGTKKVSQKLNRVKWMIDQAYEKVPREER